MPGLYDPTGPEPTREEIDWTTIQTLRIQLADYERRWQERYETRLIYEAFLRRLLMKLRAPGTTRAILRGEIETFRSQMLQGQRPEWY